MMNDEEMLQKISESAQDIEAPETLSPDAVKDMLAEKMMQTKKEEKRRKIYFLRFGIGIAAAACAAAFLLPLTLHDAGRTKEKTASAAVSAKMPAAGFASVMHKAGNYEVLYRKMKEAAADAANYSFAGTKDGVLQEEANDGQQAASAAAAGTSAADASADGSHSATNLREAGVEEGDTVKTDGQYLYILEKDRVRIVKADGGKMTDAGSIAFDADSSSGVREMYVSGDSLVLIRESWPYALAAADSPSALTETDTAETEGQVQALFYDLKDRSHPTLTGTLSADGIYQTSRLVNGVLYLFTSYGNDYILNDDIFLPEESAQASAQASPSAGTSDAPYSQESFLKSGAVPSVNGETVSADAIYLPENVTSESYLLMTSASLADPSSAIDTKAVLSWSSNIYVTQDAVFLCSAQWMDASDDTAVVRFQYADGKFSEAGACTVPGTVSNTFSMDEADDGSFRIATTQWGAADTDADVSVTDGAVSHTTNGVYIFDAQMNALGKLEGIAAGESIQGVRYIGSICYLVTYKNMDPLFSVDLSDPENPVLLGELKLPGFSTYLHFWGKDRLFGLGLETDPSTGNVRGVKLSMFNISDPVNVTEEAEKVLEDTSDAAALYDYKSLLIDPEKNLIGFETVSYSDASDGTYSSTASYRLFGYADGNFTEEFQAPTSETEDTAWYEIRGLYIGDTFYLAGPGQLAAYDMKNSYEEIGRN